MKRAVSVAIYPLITSILIVSLVYSTQPVAIASTKWHPSMPSDSLLAASDFYHFIKLVKRLNMHSDKASKYVWSRLTPATQDMLKTYKEGQPPDKLQSALVADMNAMLRDPAFYSNDAFSDVRVRGTTRRLVERHPMGDAAILANRAMLENVYPGKLRITVAGKIFQDDADAAQAQADDAQAQADQTQAQADQAQGDQQAADQQQADEAQANADVVQGQADTAAAQAADTAAQADKGFTWGDFFANIVGGAVGGFLGGLTGGLVGGLVGALGGAVGGALVSVLTWAFGSVPNTGIAFRALPQAALD